MQHYSAANYWTPGWVYPRGRLREPFPRRVRRIPIALFGSVAPVVPTGRIFCDALAAGFSGAEAAQTSFAGADALAAGFAGCDMVSQ